MKITHIWLFIINFFLLPSSLYSQKNNQDEDLIDSIKIKTNTGLRIRAAVEKEFIDQRIAGVATKKIDANLERCTKEIKIIGLMKRKKILGSFFKPVERDDADFLKIISKRLKLEKSKVENENQQRIQTEALTSENKNNETVNLDGLSTINQNVTPTQDTVSVS